MKYKKAESYLPQIISFLISPISCLLYSINNILKSKKGFIPYIFISLFLAYVAFLTLPTAEYDLYRHYKIINNLISNNVSIFNIYSWGYPFTIAHTLYCYLISTTGVVGLYSLFTVFLVYTSIFYIFVNSDGYNKLTGTTKIFITFILITLSFYRIFVFSIRNIFVFVISFVLLKLFFEEHKINLYFFIFSSIFLVFFHPVCLAIYFLYFISMINFKSIIKVLIASVCLLYKYIFELIYVYIGDKDFFIIKKLHYYFTKPDIVNTNYWFLYSFIFMVAVILMVYYYKELRKFYIFDIYCMCLILSTTTNFDLYRRFIVLVALIIPKYLIFLFNSNNKKLKIVVSSSLMIIAIISILGDIAGIKTYGWLLRNNGLSLFFNIIGASIVYLFHLFCREKKYVPSGKNVLFLITTLNGGGAEKILVDTVKLLDKDKYNITVMTVLNRGVYVDEVKQICNYKYMFDDIDSSPLIKRIYFSLLLRFCKFMPPKWLYKLFIKDNYDIEIAYLEGTPTKVISGSNRSSKKYAWVHSDPIKHPFSTKEFINIHQEIKAYKKFDKILCVSSGIKSSMQEKYFVGEKAQVQLNVLDEELIIGKSLEAINDTFDKSKFNIIAIGRLNPAKAYPRLLNVCNKLKNDFSNFKLTIIGEGLQRPMLEKYIKDNNLEQFVELKGFIKNPYPYLKQADLFVCSSIAEGFSTVVSESVVLGVPVLTTDCAGMIDILGNSEYGLIVDNDEEALYEGLKKMCLDNDLYLKYKRAVLDRSDFFKKEKRLEEFYALMEGISK